MQNLCEVILVLFINRFFALQLCLQRDVLILNLLNKLLQNKYSIKIYEFILFTNGIDIIPEYNILFLIIIFFILLYKIYNIIYSIILYNVNYFYIFNKIVYVYHKRNLN